MIYIQALVAIATAIPQLVKLIRDIMAAFQDTPASVSKEVGDTISEAAKASTQEERFKAAKNISEMIGKG